MGRVRVRCDATNALTNSGARIDSLLPGAGLNAASGYHAAQQILKHETPLRTLAGAAGATALGAWLTARARRSA